jgi:hypothetical protein
MIQHVKLFEKKGFIRRNPSSRWSSPVLVIRKPGRPDEFRMTWISDMPILMFNQWQDLL